MTLSDFDGISSEALVMASIDVSGLANAMDDLILHMLLRGKSDAEITATPQAVWNQRP
jgi:hypothetical protein